MTGPDGAEALAARPLAANPSHRDWLALGVSAIACTLLLAGVRYCPSYVVEKISLLQAWIGTFSYDLNNLVQWMLGHGSPSGPGASAAETVNSEWTYCGLVPFIVAWLVWRLGPQLSATPASPTRAGYAVLGVGLFLYLAGFLMENYYIGMGSMEFIYAGLIVLFLGWNALRLLIFPVAFLMFMWPYDFMEDVALELRLLMSSLSHHVLQFIDVPNVLQGTAIISAPGAAAPFAIDIADPCSGIRSLFALVMIAAVYSFVAFEKLWQQLIIVALAVPLVIVGNLVRIVILALGTIHFGAAFALGTNTQPSWFHEGAGYLVYLINFGGLIGIGTLLSRFTSEPAPDPAPEAPPEEHARP
jgi:exosortase